MRGNGRNERRKIIEKRVWQRRGARFADGLRVGRFSNEFFEIFKPRQEGFSEFSSD